MVIQQIQESTTSHFILKPPTQLMSADPVPM